MEDIKKVLAWSRRAKYRDLWERTKYIQERNPPVVEFVDKPWGNVPAIALKNGKWVKCGIPGRTFDGYCRWGAGSATSHVGTGRCSRDRGNGPAGIVEGFLIMAHAYAKQFGITAPEALQAELERTEGAIRWLQTKLATADELPEGDLALTPKGALGEFSTMYDKQRDRLVRVAVASINSGVAQLQMDQLESRGAQIGELMNSAITALGLDAVKEDELRTILARQMLEMPR